MSSLGGSRGERNAKPKFSALDINSLYRTSRGESLEPSQQKNTVPRKHGMQSLGKVPSARRPPANLPSLKAETSTPTESSTTANDTTVNITSASNTSSPQQQQQQKQQSNSSNNLSSQNINSNNNNNQAGGNNQQQQQQQQQYHQSGVNSSSADRNSNSNNSNSTSWSAVTGATQIQEGQPPLYQSPQFQHEFPSLDGTTPSGSKGSHYQAQGNNASNAGRGGAGDSGHHQLNNQQQQNQQNSSSAQQNHQYDGPQMSLRPQTEPSTWMQQNQKNSQGGDVVGAGAAGNSTQAPVLQVPPQLKALMPSFMYRSGAGGVVGGGGFGLPTSSPSPLSQQNAGNNNNNNNNSNSNNRLRNNFGGNNDHPSSYQGRRSGNIPPRLQNQQQQQQQQQQRQTNNQYDDSDRYSGGGGGRGGPPPLLEPEAIIHRPIIRDEELERIENIAKDDGWAKDDTIDYNQKLNFSDDEVDPPLPSKSDLRKDEFSNKKMSDDDKRLSWNKDNRHDYDRHQDSRYDKESRYSQNGVGDRRPVQVDPEVLQERVKQRREEEEKREMERRQAAAKKLQALEQKLQSKRNQQQNASEDSDNATSSSVTQGIQKIDLKDRHQYDRRDRYDKYDRGETRGSGGGGSGTDPRDRNFQSNLPPRFQRQHHDSRPSPSFERGNSYNRLSERSSAAPPSSSSSTTANSSSKDAPTTDTKNVPFAQQYDPRYIHQNVSKQLLQQKRRSDELLQPQQQQQQQQQRRSLENRGRLDSDRDDHFHGSRKISVSSNDDKLSHHSSVIEKSTSRERITSWVDELESNDDPKHRDEKKTESYTDKQKQLMKGIEVGSDYEPKQILQRTKTSVSDDSSSNLNKTTTNEAKSEEDSSNREKVRNSESPETKTGENLKKDEDDKKKSDVSSGKTGNDHKSSYNKDLDDRRGTHDKRSARGGRDNRYDSRRGDDSRDNRNSQSGRGYGSNYRGNNNSNWNNRRGGSRGGHYRYGNRDYYSESDGSDYEDDYDRKDSRNKGKDMRNKDSRSGETFAPRGEPSRRGRGGGSSSQSQYNNRRGGGMHGNSNKRLDNYGPPSSKSPFAGSDDQQKDDHHHEYRDRKVSEQSDDKSKKQQNDKASIKTENDDKSGEDVKRGHESSAEKQQAATTKNENETKKEHDQQHRKIFGGGKREDGDRSYSNQYNRTNSGGSSANRNLSQNTKSSGQKDDQRTSKPIGKPPGLSGKPGRMKTTSTSSVGSNSERETSSRGSGSNQAPQPQRSNSNKDIQMQRNTKPGLGNKSTPSNHWDAKKVQTQQESAQQSTEKSQDEGVQQQKNVGGTQQTIASDASKTDKQVLDGSTPPVNTIIFENTNYKSNTVVSSQQQQQQQQQNAAVNAIGKRTGMSGSTQKLHQSQEDVFKSTTPTSTSISDLMANAQQQQQVAAAIQQSQEQALNSALQGIDFNKPSDHVGEYDKDMKFNFTFGSDLSSQIAASGAGNVVADDKNQGVKHQQQKSTSSMHASGQPSNIIAGSTVDLGMKIASAKKIWDVMPTVMEHSSNVSATDAAVESAAAQLASNVASYQHHQQTQHQLHQFAQAHANMSQHMQQALSSSNNYSNFGTHDQTALEHFTSSTKTGQSNDSGIGGSDDTSSYISGSSQHSAVLGNNTTAHTQNMKHSSEVLGNSANICKVKPSQQQALQQASSLGLSPPPQIQGTIQTAPQSYYQAASQAYGMSAIPSPPAAVVFNQAASQAGMYNPFQLEAGRSHTQFSQYPTHAYGAAATGNAGPYGNYMQTPPAMPTAPEMYQNAFRTMGGAVQPSPFNQSQQMNNPSTVLISSTSNTLMSTSVKPPSQQIGAIGSKSGQPYGAQAQAAAAAAYMGVYPQQAPLQNNSFYSNTGGQTNAFFGTAATGAMQNYAGMFGGHGTPTPNNGPQAQFGSQYQQYRGPNSATNTGTQQGSAAAAAAAYMKQQAAGQGQSNVTGQTQQGHTQGMQDSSLQSSKGSSNNGTPDGHTQVQSAQSSPSQHIKNFSGGNWDMQNQMFQQQLINASLFQHQQQQQQYQQPNVPPHYPSPIQRPNNFDRMNMQMQQQQQGQQFYSSNRGQSNQTTSSSKKDDTKN